MKRSAVPTPADHLLVCMCHGTFAPATIAGELRSRCTACGQAGPLWSDVLEQQRVEQQRVEPQAGESPLGEPAAAGDGHHQHRGNSVPGNTRPPAALSAEHADHVRQCLAILEEAQTLCNLAAQALCPVPGFADEWSALAKPYDAVKAAWHLVDARRVELEFRLRNGRCPLCGKRRPAAAENSSPAAACDRCGWSPPTLTREEACNE